ncbi:MAG: hypothetical protein CMO35_10605 [Verrucomicrobiaceae bacterium]|jgi:hypothetical protein|nr:hypothetical protein [Verrucomicrobiaceae bacterium]MBB07382.1 hypothetical protein [Roseibacillus sp.]
MSREAEHQDPLRKPYISLPGVTGMPDIGEILAHMPAEEQHRFESAGEFVKRLAHRIQKWRERLAEDEQPVILALLSNGSAIEVRSVGEDGHSSVVVEGVLDGAACMFVSHQASFQLLCYTQKVAPEMKRKIGFHVGGEEIEA